MHAEGGVPGTLSLGIGTSARWLAMGRAGASDPGDAANPNANPSLLGGLESTEIGLLYASLYEKSSTQTLFVGQPLADRLGMAFTAFRTVSDSIPTYDATGVSTGSASFSRLEMALSAGWQPFDGLGIGVSGRGLTMQAGSGRLSAGTADLGVSYLYDGFVGVGAKVENALVSEVLARHVRGGLTLRAPSGKAALDVDIESIASYTGAGASTRFHAGGELWVVPQLALRAGVETSGFGGGIGLRLGALSMDYAGTVTELGLSNWMSLSYRFETSRPARSAAPLPVARRAINNLLPAARGICVVKVGGVSTLGWNAVPGAVGYKVYASQDPTEEGKLLTPQPVHAPSLRLTMVPPGVVVYVLVRAVDARGVEGRPSDMTEVSTD